MEGQAPERGCPMNEQTPNPAHEALKAWARRWRPAPPTEKGSILKTSEAIARELSDMVEVELATVAQWMQQNGYSIVYEASGRHGWALVRRE